MGGETVSNEVKQEAPNPHNAPDEIWLGLRGKSWEWDGCWNIRPFPANAGMVVERYVRADLLATVRRDALEAAGQIAFAEAVRQGISAQRAIAIKSKIEASANQKGEVNGSDKATKET